MKLFVVLSVLFIVLDLITVQTFAYDISFDNRFSQSAVIYQLFEMFRGLMQDGDKEKNIPIMDPYKFTTEKAQVNTLVDCEVNITNGAIGGFSNFRLENFSFIKENLSIEVVMKIPMIKMDAEYYEMKGDILKALPISGSGILHFLAQDVTINSTLYLKQSDDGKSVTIAKLENTCFSIEQISSHTEYDKIIDDVLNAMTKDLLAGYLTRFSKFISKTYEDHTADTLNSILNEYDTWSILAMIL